MKISPFQHQKKSKPLNLLFLFTKNTTSSWIWILHILSFLLRYLISVMLKNFKFSFFVYEIFNDYHFHSLNPSSKKSHQKWLWTAKDKNIYWRSSFGHFNLPSSLPTVLIKFILMISVSKMLKIWILKQLVQYICLFWAIFINWWLWGKHSWLWIRSAGFKSRQA